MVLRCHGVEGTRWVVGVVEGRALGGQEVGEAGERWVKWKIEEGGTRKGWWRVRTRQVGGGKEGKQVRR